MGPGSNPGQDLLDRSLENPNDSNLIEPLTEFQKSESVAQN